MMLLTEALVLVLKLWDGGDLTDLSQDLIAHRIPIVTFQILVRTLSTQSEGSWKTSPEITAYALLTLKRLASLPWNKELETEIHDSISYGTSFLEANESKWNSPEFIWVEKVTYGSAILSETYCLAALQASSVYIWGERVSSLCKIHRKAVDKFSQFFSQLPILSREPNWRLRASTIEGYLFAPALHQTRLDVFLRKDMADDKYLEYIPFTWTMCNNATDFGLSTQGMWDMMVISMLNFQADEYLEAVTENPHLKEDFEALRAVIHQLFDGHELEPTENGDRKRQKLVNGTAQPTKNGGTYHSNGQNGVHQSELLLDVKENLSRFVSYVLNHPKLSQSSEALRGRVRRELSIFLQSHITQGEDNARFHKPASPEKVAVFARDTYYNWVRTTSADHTSCPYSFEFFCSLIAPSGADCFQGALSRYLGQDLCRHLATMCRQYNDYGSIARDRAEHNLNSVNFLEFHEENENEINDHVSNGHVHLSKSSTMNHEDQTRETLFRIANYERACLDLAVQHLKPEVTSSTWKALQVFINVTDLYGQIYVVRDINSRMTK
jgi:hypothetical protein